MAAIAPPALAKKISSVSGTQIGASCANRNVGLVATARMFAFGPRIFRKSGWKTWKKGGVVFVGLKNSVAGARKEPLGPSTLNARGSSS